jgi:hypothetical protein
MALKQWADNGWAHRYKTSPREIAGIVAVVERDLNDAARDISADWRFAIAYNAVVKLCILLIYAAGYRVERILQHYRTIQAMPLILGKKRQADADYIDACRSKRRVLEYDAAGGITEQNADELLQFAKTFKQDVLDWVRTHHPELLSQASAESVK